MSLALSVSTLALSAYSSANATSINVAVAANFASPLGEIRSAFELDYPGDTFTITSDSSGNITNAITSGNSPGYDLFLSADTSYPATVFSAGWATASPFTYAKGEILLWSPTASSGVNVSGGLESLVGGSFPDSLVIANPSTAPYGSAAATVLSQSPWSITTIPGSGVYTASNIDNTYTAVANGTYKQGFIAKSKVCRYDAGTNTYSFNATGVSGATWKEYPYNGAHSYSQIVQNAVGVVHSGRSSAQDTVLANLISYLTASTAQGVITHYCYLLP
ncbi:molybdate ABC transporter substrate-binding protein [Methylosinus sp. Ce-a6]|uniref:molybdate ABC transporter substrate-binding protein n=1 Tax=Methylosinus sp. Ce-a6 TaxID=2172005 RepID=UPI001359B164|nr:molybdate ABC transporter substrate-binding protein [Methylosinus sp. Ce-a6]